MYMGAVQGWGVSWLHLPEDPNILMQVGMQCPLLGTVTGPEPHALPRPFKVSCHTCHTIQFSFQKALHVHVTTLQTGSASTIAS